MTSRFALAKERLQSDIVGVVGEVLGSHARPKHRKRTMWNVTNPYRAGADHGQMVVWLTGARRGAWKDFVSGEKGDAIDLVAFGLTGIVTPETRMQALEWAEDRFGLKRLDAATRARMEEQAAQRRAIAEEAEAKTQAQQQDRVRKMFYASQAQLIGTPVERYFSSRGIPLADVPQLTHSFRYRPDCEYWPLAKVDENGKRLAPGPSFPALVSAMVSVAGKLNALHLTFLSPDGNGKAPVQELAAARGLDPKDFSAKLFKGDVGGFVIRVTNGPSGLGAERAAEADIAGVAGVTEGIEDALSVAVTNPELRMFAAGSLAGYGAMPDHRAVSAWLFFRDNDWGKREAAASFDRAIARMKRLSGKPVDAISMPADWGKDVNDAIRA